MDRQQADGRTAGPIAVLLNAPTVGREGA